MHSSPEHLSSKPMFMQKEEVDLIFMAPLELDTLFREYQGNEEDFKSLITFHSYLEILGKIVGGVHFPRGNHEDRRDIQQKIS